MHVNEGEKALSCWSGVVLGDAAFAPSQKISSHLEPREVLFVAAAMATVRIQKTTKSPLNNIVG